MLAREVDKGGHVRFPNRVVSGCHGLFLLLTQ